MNKLQIIFMGTPEFAVTSLEILLANEYSIVAVVTAPDKPQGRGHKVISSPIKLAAQKYNLPVLQPINLKDPSFIKDLQAYQANLYIVVAFRMLPKVVWTMPTFGTINLHASLLPYYRGAAPINWSIIQGEKITGITTFFIEETIDTGNILLQEKVKIYSTDTAGTLTERLQYKGAKLLLKSVQEIESGNYTTIAQTSLSSDHVYSKAPKIYSKDCQINFEQETNKVVAFIRGLSPHPGAWTILNDLMQAKILEAYPLPICLGKPGEIHSDGKTYLYVGTIDGVISIEKLKIAGKKLTTVQEFLRGHKLLV